jgi:hypothetical protein
VIAADQQPPRQPRRSRDERWTHEERIAVIRRNIVDLIEQAAAYSGAGDEARTADRIAQQEEELAKLIALRDARSAK